MQGGPRENSLRNLKSDEFLGVSGGQGKAGKVCRRFFTTGPEKVGNEPTINILGLFREKSRAAWEELFGAGEAGWPVGR